MKIKISEKDTQRTILDYLDKKRIFHWRNNSGAFKSELGGFYRFGQTGSPDIFMVIDGKIYGLEVKSSIGKQSDSQKDWQERFEKVGGIYLLLKSFEDLEKYGYCK